MADNQLRGAEVQDCPAIRVTQNAGCPSIRVRITGGGETPEAPLSDVNFYDYDGKRVASYTAADFAALTEMPANPSHQGLTAQGWNWGLSDAQAYVAANGILDIGQNYITDDGKTRLYLRISDTGRSEVPVSYSQTVSGGVTIDWGDGSAPQTEAGAGGKRVTHQYNPGRYVLTLEVTQGTMTLGAGSFTYPLIGANAANIRVYGNMVEKVEIGVAVSLNPGAFGLELSSASVTIPKYLTNIPRACFYENYSLRFITIPEGAVIGDQAFNSCLSLRRFSLPKTCTIDSSLFNSCRTLERISLPASDIPNTILYLASTLREVAIPQGVSQIGLDAFNACVSLSKVTVPSSVTSIGATAFNNCGGVGEYHFKGTTPPTIAANTFNGIPADCKIYVPASAVAAYQGATNWSTYASQIVGE